MFIALGYNFCKDEDCMNFVPTNVNNLTTTTIQNGIFDHINQTKDTSLNYSDAIPTAWDFKTLIDCAFNGNIDAGNVSDIFKNVSAIKINRRIKGSFDWITLKTFTISDPSQIDIAFNDNICLNFKDYEYALVPVVGNIDGEYVSSEITSDFKGVFICDQDSIYKFYSAVGYGGINNIQKVGVFEPFGSKYPIFVSNALTNYKEGSVTSKILPLNFIQDRSFLDRKEMVNQRDELLKYFTNHKSKIIKDWNGNNWLVMITSNPSVSFDNNYGMGIMDITFEWKESGDANSNNDLIETGVVN